MGRQWGASGDCDPPGRHTISGREKFAYTTYCGVPLTVKPTPDRFRPPPRGERPRSDTSALSTNSLGTALRSCLPHFFLGKCLALCDLAAFRVALYRRTQVDTGGCNKGGEASFGEGEGESEEAIPITRKGFVRSGGSVSLWSRGPGCRITRSRAQDYPVHTLGCYRGLSGALSRLPGVIEQRS